MTLENKAPSVMALLQAGLIAGVIAAIVNVVLFYIGQAINGGPLLVLTPNNTSPQALPVFNVVFLSIAPALGAALLYWLLLRFVPKAAQTIFLAIAAIVFILFIFGPIQLATGATATWTLEIMHLVVAIPVIWMLLNKTRQA